MEIINGKRIPKQRLPFKKKTKKWGKDMLEYFTDTLFTEDESVRKKKYEMNENYNILVGRLDEERLSHTFNPMGLEGEQVIVPTSDEVISIIKPAIKTLIGEEYNRPFDYTVYVTNPDAISEKEQNIKNEIMKRLTEIVMSPNDSEEEQQIKIQRIQQWKTYNSQDMRERAANQLVGHYYEELDLVKVFNEGWKDVLAVAEEIYRIDLVNGNPVVTRCNPLNIYTLRSAENTDIENSDVIIEDMYMTPGSIIDEFHESLTPDDVSYVYSECTNDKSGGGIDKPVSSWSVDADSLIELDDDIRLSSNRMRTYKTSDGNLRVVRVYWRSLRKVGFLTYLDEVTGEQLERIVDEEYPVDLNAGDIVEWKWITEWWQGIRIGEKIFIDIKPCEIQRRDMNNISISYPPYVGTVYNYNDRDAQSIVDELKPIQYEWTVFSKKVSLLWSRNYGKLVKIDISRIPDDFDLNLYMTWIQSFGIIVEDPFKEGAKGQPAGQFNSGLSTVDLELSSSIQAALNYMLYLRELAEELTGVTRQRRGELMASEGLGVTQQGVQMSSKLTEEYFRKHEFVKQRVLTALLETAKFSLRDRSNKKLQYVLDDLSYAVYDLDIEGFTDASYGLKVADSARLMKLDMQYDSLVHAAMQSGTMTFSQFMDATQVRSLSAKVAKLKAHEEEQALKQQKQQEQQQQLQQQLAQMASQDKQMDRDHELALKQLEMNTKIEIERMRLAASAVNNLNNLDNDINKNGIADDIELKKQNMVNQQRDQELRFKEKKWNDEKNLRKQEINIKRKISNNRINNKT